MDVRTQLGKAPCRLVTVHKDAPIFHEGDPVEAVYRVEQGCLRLQIEDEEGHREIVSFFFGGDLFCVGVDFHWASAYAVMTSVVAVYSLAGIWDQPASGAEATLSLLAATDTLLDSVSHHLALLSHEDAGDRLRWFLNSLADQPALRDAAGAVRLPMTRRDIGDYLGLAPETVSRLFLRLETDGEIQRSAGRGLVYLPGRSGEQAAPPAECGVRGCATSGGA